MTEKPRATDEGVIETTIEIDAPVEAVWKALTDGEELARWFPLAARVTPGQGGEIWMSWGPPWEGASQIEVWEPQRRLQTRSFFDQRAAAVEYTLEAAGGKTRLRLVHSGFEVKSDWDREHFEGTRRGWRYELRSLRHYLERHPGEKRQVAWVKTPAAVGAGEAWRRLLGAEGFGRHGAVEGLREGETYSLRSATGETFEGRVVIHDPPQEFAGTVQGMNDALLALRTHEIAGPEAPAGHEAYVWLSAYGLPQGDIDAFRTRWRALLDELFRG